MKITRPMLDEAATQGLLSPQQSEALWAFFTQRTHDTPSFKAAHILYYLGGLIAIGAMTLFMTLGWESFGGGGIALLAVLYGAGAFGLTEYLLKRRYAVPAGLTATLGVAMLPLAVYGVQRALGLWDDGDGAHAYRDYHVYINWRWLLMEFATLAGGALALWRYRLPFMTMPIAVTLWYMSMDLAPMLLGGDGYSAFSVERKWVSVLFGLLMLLVAFWVDLRSRHSKDYAFWLYIFGVLAFWGGLSSMDSGSQFGKLIYAGINLLMIVIGAALSRRVFAVFGGFGLAGYLGYLSYDVFKDSAMFPIVLTLIGLGVIGLGIYWQRHEAAISERLRALLPRQVRELVEQRG